MTENCYLPLLPDINGSLFGSKEKLAILISATKALVLAGDQDTNSLDTSIESGHEDEILRAIYVMLSFPYEEQILGTGTDLTPESTANIFPELFNISTGPRLNHLSKDEANINLSSYNEYLADLQEAITEIVTCQARTKKDHSAAEGISKTEVGSSSMSVSER
ncbi:hypothetical protein G7Y79_00005g016480 [Physcia stellaris]|nr:hypothetical protein G7Y79_00005g016480 [Physcia stellaris]